LPEILHAVHCLHVEQCFLTGVSQALPGHLPNFFKGLQTQNTSSEKNAFEVFKLQNAKNGIFMNPEKKNF
jgi:hypothetical protein